MVGKTTMRRGESDGGTRCVRFPFFDFIKEFIKEETKHPFLYYVKCETFKK